MSDERLGPSITFVHNSRMAAKFEGVCLKQEKTYFNPKNILVDLVNCLFWSIRLPKNAGKDEHS